MHGVYVLGLKDGELYVGYSSDIKSRVAEHRSGKVVSTRRRLPADLLYCELHGNRKDAMHRELYLKSGWGRKYLARTIPESLAAFRSKIRRV